MAKNLLEKGVLRPEALDEEFGINGGEAGPPLFRAGDKVRIRAENTKMRSKQDFPSSWIHTSVAKRCSADDFPDILGPWTSKSAGSYGACGKRDCRQVCTAPCSGDISGTLHIFLNNMKERDCSAFPTKCTAGFRPRKAFWETHTRLWVKFCLGWTSTPASRGGS